MTTHRLTETALAVLWLPLGEPGDRYPAALRALRGASGCYIIRDRRSRAILYVGESHTGRLYGTITRHFQYWSRTKRWWEPIYGRGDHDPGVRYERAAVEVCAVVMTTGADDVKAAQRALITKHAPRDNIYETAPLDDEDPPF